MKLRYIIVGVSMFVWSSLIVACLSYLGIMTLLDRPVLCFVFMASGFLIGYGLSKR